MYTTKMANDDDSGASFFLPRCTKTFATVVRTVLQTRVWYDESPCMTVCRIFSLIAFFFWKRSISVLASIQNCVSFHVHCKCAHIGWKNFSVLVVGYEDVVFSREYAILYVRMVRRVERRRIVTFSRRYQYISVKTTAILPLLSMYRHILNVNPCRAAFVVRMHGSPFAVVVRTSS